MELAGKTVVITGASRGIGAGLARECAARGMKLALCARSECVLPDGASGITARVDVAQKEQVFGFAREAAQALGTIDLWINNAGVLTPVAPLRDLSAEAFIEHMNINLMGVIYGAQAYIAHVREGADSGAGQGVLINISSGAAWHGIAGWAPYCASKAALDRVSEVIQLEEGDRLRVYAVAPGIIDTAMQEYSRSLSAEVFPDVERFRQWKRDDVYNTMPFVADHILRYAFDPDSRPQDVCVRVPSEKEMS